MYLYICVCVCCFRNSPPCFQGCFYFFSKTQKCYRYVGETQMYIYIYICLCVCVRVCIASGISLLVFMAAFISSPRLRNAQSYKLLDFLEDFASQGLIIIRIHIYTYMYDMRMLSSICSISRIVIETKKSWKQMYSLNKLQVWIGHMYNFVRLSIQGLQQEKRKRYRAQRHMWVNLLEHK